MTKGETATMLVIPFSLPQAASLTAPSSHPPAGGRTKRNRTKSGS